MGLTLLEHELGVLPAFANNLPGLVACGALAGLAAIIGGLVPDLDAPASEARQALGLAESQTAFKQAQFVAAMFIKGRSLIARFFRAVLILMLLPGLAFYRATGQAALKVITGKHRGRTHYALVAGWLIPLVFGLTWQRPVWGLTGWPGLWPWVFDWATAFWPNLPPVVAWLGAYLPVLGTAFSVGYLLHLMADALTLQGIPLGLVPGDLHLLPRGLRLTTGSPTEILFVLATLGLVAWRWSGIFLASV
jgi:hypothetical protein